MRSLLNIEWTPERVLKLLAFVFALGVLLQRVDSQAEIIQAKMEASDRISDMRFSDTQQRLSRVENKLDKLP